MPTILIATDGSPEAQEAVEYGIGLAAAKHARAVLLQVVPPVDWTRLDRGSAVKPLPDQIRMRAARTLEEAVVSAAKHGVEVTPDIVAGEPADEIVAYADSIDADVTVLGSRCRGALAGALLGSVSRAVLRESRRPVLVVPSRRVQAA